MIRRGLAEKVAGESRGEGSENMSYINIEERDLQVGGSASGESLGGYTPGLFVNRRRCAWVCRVREERVVGKEDMGTVIWRVRLCRSCWARGPVVRTVAPPSEACVMGSFEWKMTWPEFSKKGDSVCQTR